MRALTISILSFCFLNCSLIAMKDRDGAEPKTKTVAFGARKGEVLKKRIVVLPFINQSSYPNADIADSARDWFLTELAKTNETVVLDWRNLGLSDIEKFKDKSGYKIEDIAKHLRSGGQPHAIVIGSVKALKTGRKGDRVGLFRRVKSEIKASVELLVVSVRSGQPMVTETREADLSEGFTRIAQRNFSENDAQDDPTAVKFVLETAFEKTIPALIESLQRFSWEGRVALIKGERVYLNAGRASGLQIGDILRITEKPEEVFDPQNDRFIGSVKGRAKGTVEVVSYFGEDGAVTRIHSGSGFSENDLVEFH